MPESIAYVFSFMTVLWFCLTPLLYRWTCKLLQQDINTASVDAIVAAGGLDQGVETERESRPSSPELPYYTSITDMSSERAYLASIQVQEGGIEGADESKPELPSPAFPVTHVLEFDSETRAERVVLSDRLSSELKVPNTTALAALEAFGMDVNRAYQWLQTMHAIQEVCYSCARADALSPLAWRRWEAVPILLLIIIVELMCKSELV